MPDVISDRKDSHLRIAAAEDVQYRQPAGFDDVSFVHCALPELDRAKIDTRLVFLKKKLATPLLITGMTGGTAAGGDINRKLAIAAEHSGMALGLGSQRPMLRDAAALPHFAVRKLCPSIPLIGNIGAANLREYPLAKIEWLVSSIEADALAIHLNPLQESVQPEGETNFEGVLDAISKLCDKLSVPVIVKETGAGISAPVAAQLFGAGAKFVEISGRGGTSWSKVEYARGGKLPGFEEWGFPAVPALAECAALGPSGGWAAAPPAGFASSRIIASGGIRSGLDVAKSVALGARLGGAALPFFKSPDPAALASEWTAQLRNAMFLAGCRNLEQLASAPLLITGRTAEVMRLRGLDPAAFASRPSPSPAARSRPIKSRPGDISGHYL